MVLSRMCLISDIKALCWRNTTVIKATLKDFLAYSKNCFEARHLLQVLDIRRLEHERERVASTALKVSKIEGWRAALSRITGNCYPISTLHAISNASS
jgi:hypothetical protein